MFIRAQYIEYAGPYHHRYLIEDSEFTVEISTKRNITSDIIDLYEQRNLPVAMNFVRYLLFTDLAPNWLGHERSLLAARRNPRFHLYEQDIHKYLTLL